MMSKHDTSTMRHNSARPRSAHIPRRTFFTLTLLIGLLTSIAALASPAARVRAADNPIYLPLTVSNSSSSTPPTTTPTTPPTTGGNGDLGFRPNPNGFNFENWGEEAANATDLGAEDLIRLFGRDKVCRSATGDCVLDASAQAWLEKQLKGMDGGHCEGLAVMSLQLFKGVDFKGKKLPSDYLPGAAATFALDKPSARNAISYYFVTQGLDPVSAASQTTKQKTPSQILQLLKDSFNGGSEIYTLGIYKRDGSGGHAITPYKVEDKGAGKFLVYVYDNNFPTEERTVEIDTTNDTWLYRGGATQPGAPVADYDGDATTKGLDLTPFSLRNQTMECPFCGQSALATASAAADSTPIQVFVAGEGNLLISNAAGQRSGYDGSKEINEITGAEVHPFKGGLGKEVPPIFELPASTTPYSFLMTGKTITKEVDADLVMSGAGYTVGMESLKLDPNESMRMTITPDGRQIVFHATADTEPMGMFLATDPTDAKQPGYIFHVDDFSLDANTTVTMTLDLAKGQLFFKDDDGNADNYDIIVERVTDKGVRVYKHNDFGVAARAEARMDFSKWDGDDNGDGDMEFVIDDEGNGFGDDSPIEVPDQP